MVQTKDRRTHLERRETPLPPYSMQIVWDPDDAIFVVTVPELPGCRTHGKTYQKAAKRGEEAIASWLTAAEHWGTPIPPPRVERHPGAAIGPFERLAVMLGWIVATHAASHSELHIPGRPPIIESPGDLLAGIEHTNEAIEALAGRGFPEEQVAAVLANLRADPEMMARFRTTAPDDEEADLRAVAIAALTIEAMIEVRRVASGMEQPDDVQGPPS